MYLHNFSVTVETTDEEGKIKRQTLRLVCSDDAEDIIETAKKVLPGCKVSGDWKKGQPIDGLTKAATTEPIEINREPSRGNQPFPNGPFAMMMPPAE